MKRILIKLLLTTVVTVLIAIGLNAYEPVISGNVAVNQLSDTYNSNADMTIYQTLKNFAWLLYLVIYALVFGKDIKKAFNKSKEEQV